MIDTKLRVDDRPILSQGTKILKKEDVPYYLVMNPLDVTAKIERPFILIGRS